MAFGLKTETVKIFRNLTMSMATPTIAKGALIRILKEKGITAKVVNDFVKEKQNIWELLGEKHQKTAKDLAKDISGWEWLDSNWVINALRDELPAIAGIFLNSKSASNWLNKQIAILKKEVAK